MRYFLTLKNIAMKWSKFNFMYITSCHEAFIYNSSTNSFFKIGNDIFDVLQKFDCNFEDCKEQIPEDVLIALLKARIFTDENYENDVAIVCRYKKILQGLSNSSTDLIIAPTTNCNFACPYCYEKGITPKNMTKETEAAVVKYVNNSTSEYLSYTWYGGEPLLCFDTIKRIIDNTLRLGKFKTVDNIVVTNGYLLDYSFVEYFRDKSLSIIQVTIDGGKNTHDKFRCHKSGISTYDTIVANIDMCLRELPNTTVIIRVNITNENKDEFPDVWKVLQEKWNGQNMSIVPCYVDDHNECSVKLCSRHEKAKFYIDLYKEHNLPINFYPSYQIGGCTADGKNSFVIDPEGHLYKCWVDIGNKDRIVGSIFKSGLSNSRLVAQYALNADKYTDEKCKDCHLFPVCDGGCSYFRLIGKETAAPYNVCPIEKKDIQYYLECYYSQVQKREL